MKTALINKYFSRQRFNRYLAATANNSPRARKLYLANISLAQAFHPLLTQFEVVFRNKLNTVLSTHFADPDWIITQKTGFMQHPSLGTSRYFLKASVQKTENNLARGEIPITAAKILSDQMFGFWLAFFVPHHYTLVAGSPIHVFPNKPTSENRTSLHQKLESVKNFRNRMNHCEPLCFRGNVIDCGNAVLIKSTLYNLIRWIDPSLEPYFTKMDAVVTHTSRITKI